MTRQQLKEAGQAYKAQRYTEAAEIVNRVQDRVDRWPLNVNADFVEDVTSIRRALRSARSALRARGQTNESADPPRTLPSENARNAPRPQGRGTNTGANTNPAVRFSKEIAPLLVQHCLDCHDDDERRGRLSMATFGKLQQGGVNGPVFEAGRPDRSLVIAKLRGTAEGQRMPLNREPLTQTQIEMFVRWIASGAKRDVGIDTSTKNVANSARLENATLDQLNQERRRLSEERWPLVFPGTTPILHETKRFMLLGKRNGERLVDFGQHIESASDEVMKLLNLDADSIVPRGRTPVFVMERLYDLHEFARMVERRSLAWPEDECVWAADGLDAYLALRVARLGQPDTARLIRGVTASWLASRQCFPTWFVSGTADTLAIRVAPKSDRSRRIQTQIGDIVHQLNAPDDFAKRRAPIDVADVAACSFVRFLMQENRRFSRLLSQTGANATFSETIEAVYGRSVDGLLSAWWDTMQRPRRRK